MKNVLNIILPDRLFSLLIGEEQPRMKDHVGAYAQFSNYCRRSYLPHSIKQKQRQQKLYGVKYFKSKTCNAESNQRFI